MPADAELGAATGQAHYRGSGSHLSLVANSEQGLEGGFTKFWGRTQQTPWVAQCSYTGRALSKLSHRYVMYKHSSQ